MTAAWRAFLAIGVMAMMALPTQAATPGRRLAKGLEAGEWELRDRDDDGAVRRTCVSDLRQLLQLRHGRSQCKSFTVAETPGHVVVTYDCGGAGNGRTDLRIETARLVQIQSQGIADGAPFDFASEGRWVGACH